MAAGSSVKSAPGRPRRAEGRSSIAIGFESSFTPPARPLISKPTIVADGVETESSVWTPAPRSRAPTTRRLAAVAVKARSLTTAHPTAFGSIAVQIAGSPRYPTYTEMRERGTPRPRRPRREELAAQACGDVATREPDCACPAGGVRITGLTHPDAGTGRQRPEHHPLTRAAFVGTVVDTTVLVGGRLLEVDGHIRQGRAPRPQPPGSLRSARHHELRPVPRSFSRTATNPHHPAARASTPETPELSVVRPWRRGDERVDHARHAELRVGV